MSFCWTACCLCLFVPLSLQPGISNPVLSLSRWTNTACRDVTCSHGAWRSPVHSIHNHTPMGVVYLQLSLEYPAHLKGQSFPYNL